MFLISSKFDEIIDAFVRNLCSSFLYLLYTVTQEWALLFELELYLLFFVFKLLLQLLETLVDVLHLLELQSVELFFNLIYQLLVLIIESVRVDQHFLEV